MRTRGLDSIRRIAGARGRRSHTGRFDHALERCGLIVSETPCLERSSAAGCSRTGGGSFARTGIRRRSTDRGFARRGSLTRRGQCSLSQRQFAAAISELDRG